MQLNPAKMARPTHADGRRYVPAIDGLRCTAAVGVITAHIGSQFGPTHTLVAYYGAAAYPALIVFFMISGFLVYRPFARAVLAPRPKAETEGDRSTNFWVYILRRVLRIFPLYWTVLFVTLFAKAHFPPGGIHQGVGLHGLTDWVQAIFLLPFPHPAHLLAGPLGIAMWTLAIELPFYALVPLYSMGLRAIRRRFAPDADPFAVLVAGPLVLIAVLVVLSTIYTGELTFPLMSLPMGMLFAVLETHQSLARRRYRLIKVLSDNWWLCIATYVGLVFLGADLALRAYSSAAGRAAAQAGRGFDPYAHIRNLYFPLQLGMALCLFIPVAFGGKRSPMVRLMASTPLQVLAPLTYGVYLWHVPLIDYTMRWFGPGFLGFPFLGTRGFGMPTVLLALGLAVTTFVCVELPAARFRDRVDRWSRGQSAVALAGVPAGAVDGPEAGDAIDPIDPVDPVDPASAAAAPAGAPVEAVVPMVADPAAVLDDIGRASADDAAVASLAATASRSSSRPRPSSSPERRSRAGAGTPSRTAPAAAAGSASLATPWCEPIDGFRAICACLAVIGHTFLSAAIFPFAGALHVLGILVALFFAISAYVLYQPFLEADVRRLPRPKSATFYLRRLLRIYPLYVMALTTYLLAFPEVRPATWWGTVRLYLFLQIFGSELADHLRGLPSAWYLCNEVIFYLAMPLMAFLCARWSNKRRRRNPADRLKAHIAMGWAMVILGPLSRSLVFALKIPGGDYLPLSHLEFFGFGVVIAGYAVGVRLGIEPPSLFRWLRDRPGVSYALVLVPALALVWIAEAFGHGNFTWTTGALDDRLRFYPYLVAIVLLMVPAVLGSARAPSNAWLSSWWMKPVSGLALHIFLWHQCVLDTMNKVFDKAGYGGLDKVNIGGRFLTGTCLTLIALVGSILVARVTQPLTDWPYEKYRAINGRMRGRGAAPQPRRMRPQHPKALEPHPS